MAKTIAHRPLAIILLFCLLLFAGCNCEDNSYSEISPNAAPRADKELVIEGPLPDVAAGGSVNFAPGAPPRAAEFSGRYVIIIVDRDDPAQTRELAPVAIDGNTYRTVIPISDSRVSPLIIIKEKKNSQNLLLASPGRVPAYNEVPGAVRRITVRGMIIDPKSTARSLLAIAKNINPDMPMVSIAREEETSESVVREIVSGGTTCFDTIIENNVGGCAIVSEFSKAVRTVTLILSNEGVESGVKNDLSLKLGGRPDAVSVLAAYVTVLNSDNNEVISAFNEARLPRSIQLSETVIDARSSDNAVKKVIQNTIDEPADNTPPAVEFASISPSVVKSGETVYLEFRASEPLVSPPVVRILGRTAAVGAVNELSFRASVTVDGSDAAAEAGFTIDEIYDRYGNKGAAASRTTDGSSAKIDNASAVAAPEISLPGGSYDSTISVTLKAGGENTTIKYTLDGSQPSADNGYVYARAITISQSATLKAVAVIAGSVSGVSTAAYSIRLALPKAAAPVFKPVGSTYNSAQNVALSSATPGAIIKYTLDGTKPSEMNAMTYDGPFEVASSLKALAVACKEGMETSELAVAVYTIEPAGEKAGKPSITPDGGFFTSTAGVSLNSATAGAVIIYTLDGTEPSVGNGLVYGGPFYLMKTCTLKAVATKPKMSDSEVVSATFEINLPLPRAAKPSITPAAGAYEAPLAVRIATANPGASIFYTLDGTTPSAANGILYSGPLSLSSHARVSAVAVRSDMFDSEAASETYTFSNIVEMPVFSLAEGSYTGTLSVAMRSVTEGALIYYTLNATTPSAANGTLYGGTIEISSSVTINAIAIKGELPASKVGTARYTITIPELLPVSAPEFKPAPGTYNSTQQVEISCATPDAAIYYTIDGSAPAKSSTKYTAPLSIPVNTVVKAFAAKDGMKDSPTAEAGYVILIPVAAPVFRPVGGAIYTSTQEVEITCATPDAVIYYTLDGSAPARDGLKYEKPVIVSKTTTIKAFAVKNGMSDSPVKEAQYPIHFPAAEPAFSVAGGTYDSTLELTIKTATEGAKIYYTIDGSAPSAANGTLYSSPLAITRPLDVKAVAVKEGMSDSNVAGASYVVPTEMVSAPLVSPNGGFFYSQTKVTITCSTADAEIYYTLDGGAPSKLSTVYSSPFTVNKYGQFKVKAAAYKAGMFDSQVSESASFTIAVPPLPQADLTAVKIDKMANENKMCLKNVTTSMEYSIDATGPAAGVTWQTGTGNDIPLDSVAAPGPGPDTSPYIVIRDKNYQSRLRGIGRYNALPLSNSVGPDHSWSLDALSGKIAHGKPNYGNAADFKLYMYVGTTAANGTSVGSGYQLGAVAAGNRTSITIPSSDKASWAAADYISFYLKNDCNTADDTSDDYYYAICAPVKVSAGPDMINNTAASLLNAADGGAFAPAGIVNIDGRDKGVTLRPGLSISANESVILTVAKTNTILAEASSSANGVTPVFGGGTANINYSGDIVAASGGKLNFSVASRAIGTGSDVSAAAAKKDVNGNTSLAGTPVVINYTAAQPAAPSNVEFAGLSNISGTLALEAGKAVGTGSGTIIIYTDNDGIYDSTNTIAQAKTAPAQNLATTGASYSFAKTMAGADYAWSPATFAAKFIGYALLDEATGNISAVSFDGTVPAPPDGANYAAGDLALLNLEYQDADNLRLKSSGNLSQASMKVLATANGGTNWHELGTTDAANAFAASGNNLPVAQYTSASAVRYAFKNAAGNVSQSSNQDGEVVTVSKFGTGNIAIGADRAISVYFTGSGAKVLENLANAQNVVTISTAKSGAVITFGTGAGDFAKDASGTSISMNIDVSAHALDRAEPNCAWKAHADANNIVSINGGHAVAPATGIKGSFIQWTAMGSGTNTEVNKLIVAPDGTVYAVGQFTTANGAEANHVAKYSNGNWSTLVDSGTSVNGLTGGNAHALAYDSANGILYVGGDFSQAGGKAIPWLAKWSNATSTWSAVGGAGGPDNALRYLFLAPDGTLYAGGYFSPYIKKYDAVNGWQSVGNGTNGAVFAMAYDQASNSIYVGGEFTECYNSASAVNNGSPLAAKWNIGSGTWEALGAGLSYRDVKSVAIGTGGAVYYGGLFAGGGGGYLKKWNGAGWSDVGAVNDEVKALVFDSTNGILYVGGSFSTTDGSGTMNKIAQYYPATNTWASVGAGMSSGVFALDLDGDGTLYAGGSFFSAGEATTGDTTVNRIAKR